MSADFDGRVLRRGDEEYDAARRATVWNARTPDRHPDVVVQAASEADLVRAVRLARDEGLRIGVRSGSSQLVIQDVNIQTHHTARNRMVVCSTPIGVKCASRVWEIWVMAKTKTRSKNSST